MTDTTARERAEDRIKGGDEYASEQGDTVEGVIAESTGTIALAILALVDAVAAAGVPGDYRATIYKLDIERSVAVVDRDALAVERNQARLERDEALAERDRLRAEVAALIVERDDLSGRLHVATAHKEAFGGFCRDFIARLRAVEADNAALRKVAEAAAGVRAMSYARWRELEDALDAQARHDAARDAATPKDVE